MAQYNPNLVAQNNACLFCLQPVTTNTMMRCCAQNSACLFCLQPVTTDTIMRCCARSCHIPCAHNSTKCPSCLYLAPLAALKIHPFQTWKEDVQFAEQVRAVWKDNPLWFAHSHAIENHITEGYWGRTRHPIDYNRHILYFLGHAKSEVIPNMRTVLDRQPKPFPTRRCCIQSHQIDQDPKTNEKKQDQLLVYDERVIDPNTFKTYPYGYCKKSPDCPGSENQ